MKKKRKDKINFHFYTTVESEKDNELSIRVNITLSVRFDILYWAKEYYHDQESINIYKNELSEVSQSLIFRSDNLPHENNFIYFKTNGENFEISMNKLVNKIEELTPKYFSKYESLNFLYNEIIEPIFENGIGIIPYRLVGSSWMFNYLTITKIVAPSKLEALNEILYNHLKYLYEKGEPNAEMYYPIYEKAIEELIELDFTDVKIS